jgi:hypothetical protein
MSYNIYTSPWNGTEEEIDFSTPAFTSDVNPIILPTFAGVNTGLIYLCVRETINGIEEKNWNIIAFSTTALLAPTYLGGQMSDGNTVILRWFYNLPVTTVGPIEQNNCDGFYIYQNNVKVATVPFTGSANITKTLNISIAKTFKVSAYKGLLESNYSNSITVSPDNYTAVTQINTQNTWRE